MGSLLSRPDDFDRYPTDADRTETRIALHKVAIGIHLARSPCRDISMKPMTTSRLALVLATALFVAWTLLNTVFWPVEDYANASLAYAESTNQIVRGMSIGIAGYLCCLALILAWNAGVPTNARPK